MLKSTSLPFVLSLVVAVGATAAAQYKGTGTVTVGSEAHTLETTSCTFHAGAQHGARTVGSADGSGPAARRPHAGRRLREES